MTDMPKKYRKHFGRFENWHFHTECSSWPEGNYFEEDVPSRPEEICLECIRLHNTATYGPSGSRKRS